MSGILVSAETSAALDAEARNEWGFNAFSLIEAAGRSCAQVFQNTFPDLFASRPRITVAAGSGNNGADAMAMLRYWILIGALDLHSCALVVNRMSKIGEKSPRADLLKSLKKMKVPILVWDGDMGEAAGRASDDALANSDIIIDGISGTGLEGPLYGTVLEMLKAVNKHRNNSGAVSAKKPYKRPYVVSIDLPSGNSDRWEPGMPIVEADLTLAIEPQKICIYAPSARPHAGIIVPVSGIFPREIVARCRGAELLEWESVHSRIPKVRPDAYKNERGTVEIRAGSPGTTGAALIAARGAQAAGAGLVRLVADNDIYQILASQTAGIMVFPAGESGSSDFAARESLPDAILLGPGWGVKPERMPVLEKALLLESKGTPLILDADAIELARDKVFNNNTILTPHPGEFSKFSGIGRDELLCRPLPVLQRFARERKAFIIFKGHVIIIASPDGRLGVVDGMTPGLAAGGSGDLLAGFCAAIAARMLRREGAFDGYTCACAAATLLIASGKSNELKKRFTDPLELAGKAAGLAGEAWLASGGWLASGAEKCGALL